MLWNGRNAVYACVGLLFSFFTFFPNKNSKGDAHHVQARLVNATFIHEHTYVVRVSMFFIFLFCKYFESGLTFGEFWEHLMEIYLWTFPFNRKCFVHLWIGWIIAFFACQFMYLSASISSLKAYLSSQFFLSTCCYLHAYV